MGTSGAKWRRRCLQPLPGPLLVVALSMALTSCGGGGASGGGDTATQGASSGSQVAHPAVQTFPAGENPRDLVVAAGRIWVLDFGEPTVREFDSRGHLVRKVKLDGQSIAPGPNSVWVGELSNSNSGPQGPVADVDARSGRAWRRLTPKDS